MRKMIRRLKACWWEDKGRRELLLYVFFGVLTTVVNYVAYWMLTAALGLRAEGADEVGKVAVNVVAWVLSVAFAYGTNRKYVFQSKAEGRQALLREIGLFVSARLLSLVLFDVLGMYICMTVFAMNDLIAKLLLNVLVVIFNYVASKLVVFQKTKRRE